MTESSNLLIYQTQDGSTKIQVQLTDNTVWLTQADMVELFQTTKQNISLISKTSLKKENWTKIQLSRNT